ncbi:MAG: LPS assembly lipoprotein LptE [Sulfuritalea sp.]|nr:LPS assembly lipoprotein LptE [Sulfuritalea sp.]
MRAAKLSVILLLVSLLAACGFKLRGSAELPGYKLPFSTIALTLAPTSEFYALLKRNIEASSPGTRVVDAKERSFTFKVHANVAAATPAAQVKYTDVRPEVVATEYIAPSTIVLRRDITSSDDPVLSKESEEALLQRDMQSDLVQQLMRRLAAAKLKPVKVDGE